jgi:hypothetical protein
MSAGIAIGSFVDGLFWGKDKKNAYEDRDRDNERGDERFQWEKEDREWLKENRGWARDDRARTVARRGATGTPSANQSFWSDLAKGFGEAAAGGLPAAPAPSPAAQGAAPEQAAPTVGLGVLPSSAPAAPTSQTPPPTAVSAPSPQPPRPAPLSVVPSAPSRLDQPGAPGPTSPAQPAPVPAAAPQKPTPRPRGVMDWIVPAAMADDAPDHAAAPPPPLNRPAATHPETNQTQVAIPQQGGFGLPGLETAPDPQNAPAPAPSRWAPTNGAGVIGDRGRRARNMTDDPNLLTAADQGDLIESSLHAGTDTDGHPINPPREQELTTALGEIDRTINIYAATTNNGASNNYGLAPQPQRTTPGPAAPRAAPTMPEIGPGIETRQPTAPAQDTIPQPRRAPQRPGAGVIEQASQPMERQWATMERVRGVERKPLTGEAAQRVADVTLQTYLTQRAPDIMQHYLSQGQVDKATAFNEFIQSSEAKEGMASWARAVNAASVGDDRGFVDAIETTYNATGYYDDGYEVVRGKSGIDRDRAGNITGATITIMDQKTGAEFEQRFDDMQDIYEYGLSVVSPEAVFEQGWNRLETARATALELEKLAVKNGVAGRDLDTIMKVGKHLNDTRLNFETLPPDEQFRAILDFLAKAEAGESQAPAAPGAGSGASSPPPVLR